MGRVKENLLKYYVCGQCNTKIFSLQTEDFVVPCPECDWHHLERKPSDVPTSVRYPIS